MRKLLHNQPYEKEALRRVPVRKGVLTNEEVLEEVKAVRREVEEKPGVVEPARRVELLTC